MIYLLKYAQYNISNKPPKTIERNHKESYLHLYSWDMWREYILYERERKYFYLQNFYLNFEVLSISWMLPDRGKITSVGVVSEENGVTQNGILKHG